MVKNKGGCPTKYKESYCQEMIDYFNNPDTTMLKDGTVVTDYPTFEAFATKIDVCTKTLDNWKDRGEFLQAYLKCKNIQKHILIQKGLYGDFNPGFAKLVAINTTDMKDKTEVEQTTTNIVVGSDKEKSILEELEKDD